MAVGRLHLCQDQLTLFACVTASSLQRHGPNANAASVSRVRRFKNTRYVAAPSIPVSSS